VNCRPCGNSRITKSNQTKYKRFSTILLLHIIVVVFIRKTSSSTASSSVSARVQQSPAVIVRPGGVYYYYYYTYCGLGTNNDDIIILYCHIFCTTRFDLSVLQRGPSIIATVDPAEKEEENDRNEIKIIIYYRVLCCERSLSMCRFSPFGHSP